MASPAKRANPSSLAKPPGVPPPKGAAAAADEDPRILLRRSWELASVLHFLRVFEPVIKGDLGLSAEEIETALISNNHDLARIRIALLKRATAKKLSDWWFWVAEGPNPFRTSPGTEVETYKQQDPIKRLFILKALCEVRSEVKFSVNGVLVLTFL